MLSSPPQTAARQGSGRFLAALAALPSLLLLAIVAGVIVRGLAHTGGRFVYPLDDAYITLAMAKHLALEGVWGVTRYGFTGCASSPVFILLIAGLFKLTGVHDLATLIVDAVLALIFLWIAARLFFRAGLGPVGTLIGLFYMVLAAPLHALVLGAMEHVLQLILVLVFADLAACMLSGSRRDRARALTLIALTPFLIETRPEDAFLILAAGLFCAFQRRWAMFFGLGAASVTPLAIYAAISTRCGWFALPNSLLLKSNLRSTDAGFTAKGFLAGLWINLSHAPHVIFLFLLAAAILWTMRRQRILASYPGAGLYLFLVTATLHLLTANVGWFFRYEAYLLVLGGYFAIVAVHRFAPALHRRDRSALAALAALAVLALGLRTFRSIWLAPTAMWNIYDQQLQTARLLETYFPGGIVMLNDVGAVSYYTDVHILDTVGLASMDSARAHIGRYYSPVFVRDWASREHAQLAIVYKTARPPAEWIPIGWWRVPNPYIVGESLVNVYAVQPDLAPALAHDFAQFRATLPPGVRSGTAALTPP